VRVKVIYARFPEVDSLDPRVNAIHVRFSDADCVDRGSTRSAPVPLPLGALRFGRLTREYATRPYNPLRPVTDPDGRQRGPARQAKSTPGPRSAVGT